MFSKDPVRGPGSIAWADLILVGACGREILHLTMARIQAESSQVCLQLSTLPISQGSPNASWEPSTQYQSLQWSDLVQIKTGNVRLAGLGRPNAGAKLGTVRLPPPPWLPRPPMPTLSSPSATRLWGSALTFFRDALNSQRHNTAVASTHNNSSWVTF